MSAPKFYVRVTSRQVKFLISVLEDEVKKYQDDMLDEEEDYVNALIKRFENVLKFGSTPKIIQENIDLKAQIKELRSQLTEVTV